MIRVRCGPLVLAWSMADAPVAERLRQRWQRYQVDAPAHLTVTAEARPLAGPADHLVMHPVTYTAEGPSVIHVRFGTLMQATWEVAAQRITCVYDARLGAETPEQLQWTLECFDILACWLAALWLPPQGAILLHTCGVLDDAGRVDLFSGPSGVGKSTLGGTAPPERVLCDEVLLLTRRDGALHITTVPWRSHRWGRAPGAYYPVGRVVLLHRSGDMGTAALAPHVALNHLLHGGLYGRMVRPADYQRRLALAVALVEEHPCYRLRYAWPDEDPWPQIQQLPSVRRAVVPLDTALCGEVATGGQGA